MQNSHGNMYDFVTHTANPIKGLCPHECSYCYMKDIFKRYGHDTTLRLDPNELKINYGSGKFIFLGTSTDMFAQPVESAWIKQVLDHCAKYDCKYLLQTKNPARFFEFLNHPLMQDKNKVVLATTIETNRDVSTISLAPSIDDRVNVMAQLSKQGYAVMVTMEPIMDFDHDAVINIMRTIHPFQVNIGANTNRTVKLPEPDKNKLNLLIDELRTFVPVVKLKTNLDRLLK